MSACLWQMLHAQSCRSHGQIQLLYQGKYCIGLQSTEPHFSQASIYILAMRMFIKWSLCLVLPLSIALPLRLCILAAGCFLTLSGLIYELHVYA